MLESLEYFFNKVVGPPVATSESHRLVEKRLGGMPGAGGGWGCANT